MNSKILSTGIYVPPKVVTNNDLEKMMDTSDEWIQQRSGIKERRWVSPGETTLSMATAACREALNRAKMSPEEIDFIIFGCLVSDFIFPGTGCLLQESLGCKKFTPTLDIRNQCSGFVYALNIADAFIRSGQYKNILIVGSEIHSTSLNLSTEGRDIAVLFGDGAGAMIVTASDQDHSKIIRSELHSEGRYATQLSIQKPTPNDHPRLSQKMMEDPLRYPVMDGKMVFKNAVQRMTEVALSVLEKENLKASDLDFVIAHQANMRIIHMVMDQLGLPLSKTHNTLDHYGNTTMATIPITFDEALLKNKIKRGDLVLFVAFGAGFTWGANLLRY